jgi:hypothetical protein
MEDIRDSRVPIKGARGKIRSGVERKHFGSRRRYKRAFDFNPTRRREIEQHARHVGAADSDDFDRWLLAWCWHNPEASDLRWSLKNWTSTKLGRALTDAEVDAIIDDVENKRTRRRWSADNLARWLGLTYAVRTALRITTIGAVDVPRRKRKELRRGKDRIYQARKRRARGARPHWESLSQTQPWRELGMSRRTWERHRNKAKEAGVAKTSAAIFLSYDDESASPGQVFATSSSQYPEARATQDYHGYSSLPIELRMMALGLPMPEQSGLLRAQQ